MAWLLPELDCGAEPELKPLPELELLELPELELLPELEEPELELPELELPELEEPLPDEVDPVPVPVEVVALPVEPEPVEPLVDVVVWAEPGSASATTPAVATLATPTAVVTERTLVRPRSRAATALMSLSRSIVSSWR